MLRRAEGKRKEEIVDGQAKPGHDGGYFARADVG
jgi:hypothetical protein